MQVGHWSLERAMDRISSAKRKRESPDEDEVAECEEAAEAAKTVVNQVSCPVCQPFTKAPISMLVHVMKPVVEGVPVWQDAEQLVRVTDHGAGAGFSGQCGCMLRRLSAVLRAWLSVLTCC